MTVSSPLTSLAASSVAFGAAPKAGSAKLSVADAPQDVFLEFLNPA
jgi:hypothetical protein